ncbi:hypothetical protein EYZ11_006363 [Aspergillus tanneri]|uniref:NAD-dependent epimerase/dehydratase domain-containing protein n=1 Tax=Aspergillus tanneri TaxID=1220188 RepID=A0A4S3JG83_9EURO|nr:uncharacterized protein ATNIH1004_008143 [Aspergillus tanneri]KAA8643947.1 hypothetical protein ATNIH1004_008143 [Aspergillus tanneri]THC94155.1 hypothetical protein EYZ11_006363 [Aspergillus tanneri]
MSLVFITGVTGFIGSQVALHVLQAGYRVRLAIRRPEQADKIRRIFANYEGKFEFDIVPDLTLSGCYDSCLQDVQYVLHLASPLPSSGSNDLLTPAVQGTVSILESAMKVSSIRKVVITASVVSLVSLGKVGNVSIIRENNDIDYTVDPETVPSLDPMGQYHASKLASYKATMDFVRDHRPVFDVVTLHPVFVFGRSLIQESPNEISGTPELLFKTLVSETPLMEQFLGVHIDDVAGAHVRALNDGIKGFESYLLAAERRSLVELHAFVRSKYPQLEVKWEPTDSVNFSVDAAKAKKALGMSFKGMEEQVQDVVDQQLELRNVVS